MPRIQEYNLESEGQGPVGGLDPRVEAAAAVGNSVRDLGATVTHEGEIIHHRAAQADVSGASAQVSQAHVDFNQMLQEKTADGTLDVDEVKQKLQDWQDKASQNFSTVEGRNYFNKTANRLKLAVTTSAIHGSAQIASANAKADFLTAGNARMNRLYQDPSMLGEVLGDNEDDVKARVSVDSLKAKDAPELLRKMNADATIASIDSWSRMGATEDEHGNQTTGAQIAKHALDKGLYDDLLSPRQKEEAYTHISQAERANEAQAAQKEAQARRDARTKWDNVLNQNLEAYKNHTLKAKTVLDWDLPPEAAEFKMHLIDRLEQNARTNATQPANPRLITDYVQRLILPDGDPRKINNPEDLWHDPKLRPKDVADIWHYYNADTTQGKDLNASRSLVFEAAKSPGTGIIAKDPIGNKSGFDKYAEFMRDVREKEIEADQAGIPRRKLYDPKEPGNLYDLMKSGKYQNLNLNDPMNAVIMQQRQQVLPTPPAPAAPLGNSPEEMHKKLLEFRAKKGSK